MTIYVFHGDDLRSSRLLLSQAVTRERAEGREIRVLAGDKILAKDLSEALGTENLFAPETIIIENLLGRLRSKEKDLCLTLISSYRGKKNILLWEKKSVTKLALAKLGKNAKVTESKAPQLLFTFLDSFAPGNAKQALKLLHRLAASTEDILIFTLLARRIGDLLIASSGSQPAFVTWQLAKLKSQAKLWGEASLILLHDRLLGIDEQVKSGQTKLSYLEHLDILLVNLLG